MLHIYVDVCSEVSLKIKSGPKGFVFGVGG